MALTDVKSEQIQSSVALAGSPTTTTQSASDNSTKIATTAYVETAVANLVASAPASLNTLDELAAALNDDASFSTTVTNSIAAKLPLAGGTMSGALNMGSQNITNAGTLNGITTTQSVSGTRWGVLPEIAGNGVMEIGRYVDFHATSGDTSDYGARFDFDGSKMILTSAFETQSTIKSSSNISIEAASGNPQLLVKTAGAGNNPNIRIQADSNYWDIQTLFSNADDELDFRYNGSSKLIIDKDGTVGIGTSSPSGLLHLKSASPQLYMQSNDGNAASIVFGDVSDASRGQIKYESTDDMVFLVNNLSEKLRIKNGGDVKINSGNLGIGMDAVQALDIDRTSGLSIRFYESGTFRAGLQVANSSGQMIGTSVDNDFAIRSQSNLLFAAGGNAERMRIDSAGSVGIKETSPDAHLHVTSPGAASGSGDHTTASNIVQIWENSAGNGFPRVAMRSAHTLVNCVHNFETGKNAYWGEPTDTGTYYFRGRHFTIEHGNLHVSAGNISLGTAGKGIDFSATADGTGSSNRSELLDDYEEGTFNAVIYAENGSITVDSSDNLCFYTKIGRLVTVSGRISVSSVSNPSGQLDVGNLPFNLASAGETSHAGAVTVNIYNAATNFGGEVVGEMRTTGGARILIRGNGGTTAAVHTAAANIDSGSLIGFTATYPAT